MEALRAAGFADIAAEFGLARQAMFGTEPLEESAVEARVAVLAKWEDELDKAHPILAQLQTIYHRLIPRLEKTSSCLSELATSRLSGDRQRAGIARGVLSPIELPLNPYIARERRSLTLNSP